MSADTPKPEPPDGAPKRPPASRVVPLVGAAVIGVAFAGFFTGIAGSPEPAFGARESRRVESALALAPSHGDLAQGALGVDVAARQRAAFAALAAEGRRGLEDEVAVPTEAEIRAALEARSARRSYDGAPPRIPHPVTQRGDLDCVGCHTNGLVLEGRVAPMMSHDHLTSCTQCHVGEEGPMPGAAQALESGPPWQNTFAGLEAPTQGPRVWDGAPPVIPHTTHMRERCESCHGVLADGLRTTHPWRQSCTQCHAPSAEFDVRPDEGLTPVGATR
ncbi:MAG: hypothetical protein KF901_08775 [Myxococcales bacterium]|nr:hypothetical protein [Myxococcales bacterium]